MTKLHRTLWIGVDFDLTRENLISLHISRWYKFYSISFDKFKRKQIEWGEEGGEREREAGVQVEKERIQ